MSKVSIVCAAYNSAQYLPDMINSVMKQTYENWELIIINDYSTDHTYDVAKSYEEKDNRITVLCNSSNLGPAKSRNKGIKKANGTYLAFLDSDDLWEKNFISTSIEFLDRNNCYFCFASYKRVDEELEPLYEPFIVPDKVSYEDLLKTCSISCLTAFLNIDHLGKYYMPDIRKRQDYGFFLKILKDVDYAYGIEEKLAIYRIRKDSVSRNKFKAMQYVWKLYREVEELSFFKSLYLIIVYAYNGFKKYYS